jgi:hypothetical protein
VAATDSDGDLMTFDDNPTLDDLLGDPITQAIMTADGIDPQALAAMLASIARGIRGRPSARVMRETASGCASGSRIRSQQLGAS